MQTIDEPSPQAPTNPMYQRDWMKVAEYASIAGSAVGSLVAAVSGQILYAATPLTLTLYLNLMNRERFEHQMHETINSAIADVHSVVASLHQQVQQALPEDAEDLDAILSDLQYKLRNLEANVLDQQDWETVNVRFLLLEEKLAEVRLTISELQQHHPENVNLEQIQTTVERLQTLADQPTADLTVLEHQIHQLQHQVARLHKQNQEVVKPYLQKLTRAVKQLQN